MTGAARASLILLLASLLAAGCQGAETPSSSSDGVADPAPESGKQAPVKPSEQPAQPGSVGDEKAAKKKQPRPGLDTAAPPPPAGSPKPAPKRSQGAQGQVLPGLSTLGEAQAEFKRARARLEQVYGGRGAVALSSTDTRCKTACVAFSSLERSATAICRLTSDSDARCTDAKRVVEQHRKKVVACQCP